MRFQAFFALFICLFLTGCDDKDTSDKPLTVITSPDNPPFEFKDTSKTKGKVQGFDIDLVRMIGEKMDKPIKIIEAEFSTIIPALQSGRADMTIAGLSATEERRKSVDFSNPYFELQFSLLLPEESTIEGTHDLRRKKIGAQLGSSHEIKLMELSKEIPKLSIVSLNKIGDLVQELKNRRVDAILIEESTARKIVAANTGLKYVPLKGLSGESQVIAFPKGSPWIEPVNAALKELESEGEIKQLEKKWFGDEVVTRDFWSSTRYILGGVKVTLAYTIVSLICGFIWGGILAGFKVGEIRPLNWFAAAYTSVFRGTPLILQLTIVYFAFPFKLTYWQAGILTFTLNSGAYISEIIRAGILAVDKGQMEAARSLGVPYLRAMYDIILPQAIRNILPALANESIDLLKESALISVIGEADLLRRAKDVASEQYTYFEPLMIAGAMYYIMVMILASFARLLERKLRIK